jgi:SAM-dependent methyltransferase
VPESPATGVHERIQRFWDADAETYDRTLSHGLGDPVVSATWTAALARHLPAGARVLDVGAGTGSISLLAADLGHHVTALDLYPGMLAQAERKASDRGLDLTSVVAPADDPPTGPFDAVIERHVLWTLPDPVRALARWRDVTPGGRLVLYEGFWTPTGPLDRARRRLAGSVGRAVGAGTGHHAEYEPDLRASLPLAAHLTPERVLKVAAAAGWRALRIERLRDVEWALRRAGHRLLGRLEAVPLFAVLGDA